LEQVEFKLSGLDKNNNKTQPATGNGGGKWQHCKKGCFQIKKQKSFATLCLIKIK